MDDEKELNGILFPLHISSSANPVKRDTSVRLELACCICTTCKQCALNAEWPFKHEPRVKEDQEEDAGNDEAEAEKEEPSSGDEADVEISDTEGEQEKPLKPTLQVSTFSCFTWPIPSAATNINGAILL